VKEMNMINTASMQHGLSFDSYKEDVIHRSYKQASTKPDINDVICHKLDGDALKDALFVIDNIRENKMKIKWSSVNTWAVKYRLKHVCNLKIEKDSLSIGPVNDVLATRVKRMSNNQESIAQLIDALRDSMTGQKEAFVLSH